MNNEALKTLFLARNPKRAKELALPMARKEMEPPQIKTTTSFNIDYSDAINDEILTYLETYITQNTIKLVNTDDFGLPMVNIEFMNAEMETLAGGVAHPPLRYFLKELLVRQLDLQIELLALRIAEPTNDPEDIQKTIEHLQHKASLDLALKDSEIAVLKRQSEQSSKKFEEAKVQLGKLIDGRLREKEATVSLSQQRAEIEEDLQKLAKERDDLNQKLTLAEENKHKETESNVALKNQITQLVSKMNQLIEDANNAKREKAQLQTQYECIKKEREVLSRDKESASKRIEALSKNTSDTSGAQTVLKPVLTIIVIDLNNIVRSSNPDIGGLRLFDPKAFFEKLASLIDPTEPIQGYVFCNPHLKHHQSSAQSPLVNELKWVVLDELDGFIEGTKKAKHLDTDGRMIKTGVEALVKNSQIVKRLIIASGDKHMVPIAESCKENAPTAQIIIVAKADSLSPRLAKLAFKVVTI